jgi:alanyl-tRNA synthetase
VTSDEIREAFLQFFKGKNHTIVPSSSLIPHGDPTLLLTTAGVVQMKPYFAGTSVPPATRMASCQKCFRTTDIESVGDTTHNTFFEMLGNFSVGDYYKKEAIDWAWEFLTAVMKIPSGKLWITIYTDDDEAFDMWRENGVPAEKIVRLGDNFWGPAIPAHADRTAKYTMISAKAPGAANRTANRDAIAVDSWKSGTSFLPD